MNDSLDFSRNECNALTRLVAELRSEAGFTVNDKTNTLSMLSAFDKVLEFDCTLNRETRTIVFEADHMISLKLSTPMSRVWPLPNQRAAADDIENKLLNSTADMQ